MDYIELGGYFEIILREVEGGISVVGLCPLECPCERHLGSGFI